MTLAVLKPAYVFNNARLYPGSVYAPPAVGPYFEGLFGVGYTQKNLTKQFEYTVKQMSVSPFSINSNKHIKNIRDKYGYSDNGMYETMGVVGGVVGAGVGAMIGSGLMQIQSPLAKSSFWKGSSWQKPFTFNKLEDAIPKRTAAKQLYKALPEVDTFVKETQKAITKEISLVIEKQGDKITRELIEEAIDRGADSVSGKVIKGIKPEKIKQVTETIKNKTKASMPDNAIDNLIERIHKSAKNYLNLQKTKDALALAINEAVEKAIKEIDVSSIEKLTATLVAEKMAKEGVKTLSDDAIKTIKIIATETITKKVTEEVTEEVTDKFVKEAAEVATKELTEEVASETTTKVAKKGAGIAPHIGVAIDVASLGFSIAGLVQSIEQGDALNIVFNSVLAVADTADLAGNFIPGFGTALSVIAGIVSIGATMLQGWLVGQTIGKSFSAEGAQAQALFAENLYASTINRPISSIGTILTMIAVPALTSVLGKGVGSSNAILRTASFLPDWLSTSALGNQVRAGISMMAVQGMNQIAAPIDNALPWAADDPNDINFVSAVSLYGDINDNLYGATRNKAILKGLITNDSKAMTDAMARAWGYSDEMTYAINFDDVRQATKFDGGPFVNALIGVIGEMVIDPQNMYEVAYANSAEKVINEGVKIAERKLRRLQAQDILYKDTGEYTILFGEQGLFKNNAARNTYLKRLLKAKLDDGAKGVQETGANLFSHRFKGTQIKALYPQVGAQLTLINKLFDDILSGETFLTDEVDTTLKFKQSLQELYTLKNKTDNTTDIEKQASIDALNTYKKLLSVYTADDDINLITSKVVDDYALTVRDSNIKSLYKNYSSFKAHMDMTDMLARGILKFGNPIGHVFKLGISKGIPRAASDIFRRFFGKNKQQTIISVDEALAEHDEILSVTNKKIVELREKQKRDTDLIERLTREREDNTARTSEIVQTVEDVGAVNERIKGYNEELDIMKEILDGWNALHEQVKNERALAATITYDYNGKTYTMNAAEEQRIISNIKKYEGTMDKEALAKTIKEGKRTKDIPTLEYLREKELYNTHKLNTKGGDSFLGIVAYMKTMTSLLAQTQLTVEETRTKVLKSMQYILSYANTYTKKPITEVLDEHIGNLRAKIKTSSDAIIELEASKVSTVSDAEDKINKDINAKIAGHKSNIKTKSEELKNVLKRREINCSVNKILLIVFPMSVSTIKHTIVQLIKR